MVTNWKRYWTWEWDGFSASFYRSTPFAKWLSEVNFWVSYLLQQLEIAVPAFATSCPEKYHSTDGPVPREEHFCFIF